MGKSTKRNTIGITLETSLNLTEAQRKFFIEYTVNEGEHLSDMLNHYWPELKAKISLQGSGMTPSKTPSEK